MDYALAAIAVLVVTAVAFFYSRISARKHALVHAYVHLDSAIAKQCQEVARVLAAPPTVGHTHLQSLVRRADAIRTLGLDAIDQRIDVYDAIHAGMQGMVSTTSSFEDEHRKLEHIREQYNRAALAYNDCQRNAVLDWLAGLWGHRMAPPC